MTQYNYKEKRILIVDDQRPFQIMLKTMLSNFGAANISFANTGELAITACKKQHYDILLVDYNLGTGKNGRQLLEELRERQLLNTHSLFILITGDNSRGMVLGALEIEPDDFITKPFSQNQLNLRLKRADKKKQALIDIYKSIEQKNHSKTIELCIAKLQEEGRYHNQLRNILAHSYISNDQIDDAQILLKNIMDKSQQTWVKVLLGQVYYLQGAYDKAIELLDLTIIANPLVLEAYDWLARSLQKINETQTAVEVIKRATDISAQSIQRQELQADLAEQANDLILAKESYNCILQLSRKSVHSSPQHLCNYVRSIIDAANNEEETDVKNKLLQEVSSTLFRGRLEEAHNDEFDYNAFEGINQARVLASKGDYLKAKRTLFKSNEPYLNNPKEAQDPLLLDTYIALNSIGEFEYAQPFAKQMDKRFKQDSKVRKTIQKMAKKQESRDIKQQFEQLNRQGIRAYEAKHYQEALNFFTNALKVAPVNTGAAINKIQVSLELLNNKTLNTPDFIDECRRTFSLLDGIALAKAHQNRLPQLKQRFTELTNIKLKS